MTYAPTNPLDVPPYQVQDLISSVDGSGRASQADTRVICAQALGSEIYVGCSNGELLRFALQANNPNELESYRLLSRQTIPNHKPIEEIVIVPYISRALILSERQIYFYIIPSLDPVPFKPVRNVVTFAVDDQHLRRPPPPPFSSQIGAEPVDFCIIKRNAIGMFTLHETLGFQKEIPLPKGGTLARRSGPYLCTADKEYYNVINLETSSLLQVLPLSQAFEPSQITVKPSITVITEEEFLIVSWNGSSSIGIFIKGNGDPVRGTLEWPSHPEDICLDYPYIATLLQNNNIEIHDLETQSIKQVIPVPRSADNLVEKLRITTCLNGYLVPSSQKSDKMRMVSIPLLRDSGEARPVATGS